MNTICRLCLKKCDGNFQSIENATEIMNILPEFNLAISKEAVICTKCWEHLKMCCNFKSSCLGVEDFIVQFINHKEDDAMLNLKHIYLSKETNVNEIPEDHDICRLCMSSFKGWMFMSLDRENGNALLETMMLEKCLPELDLSVTEKPVICVPCHGSLQQYFNFITDCSNVEESIKRYFQAFSTNGTSPIELKDILEFTTRNIPNKFDNIQIAKKFCENKEHVDEQKDEDAEKVSIIKVEETCLQGTECKTELTPEDLGEMDGQQFNDVSEVAIKCEIGDEQVDVTETKYSYCQERINGVRVEDFKETLDLNFKPCRVEVEREKYHRNSVQDSRILLQEDTQPTLANSQKYSVAQPSENPLLTKSVEKYINEHGKHGSLQESALNITAHKCSLCSFQTKFKSSLIQHLLHTHYNPSEIRTYQCEHCSFQAKGEKQLKRHMLTHKSPSEPTIYRCDFCVYQVKHKRYFIQHLLTHTNPSKIKLYKCASCSFQTKHKQSLYPHRLTHKDPSEVTMHRCDICAFSSKHKNQLKVHLLIHKDSSEVTMYRCASCSYQTKNKQSLIPHFLIHKKPAEVTMYQCDVCSFQTKHKSNMNSHLLIHKKPSEVMMQHCEFCPFQSKHRRAIVRHVFRRHKKAKPPTREIMYRCELCAYQVKRKYNFDQHLLAHKTS